MNNRGFEIKLNNKLLCKAGIKDNHGVVHCIAGAVLRKENNTQEIYFNVIGLNSDSGEHVKWLTSESNVLKENDIITIKIIKDNFDLPKEVSEKKSDEFLLQQKIKTYKKLKEQLKGYI